MSEKKEEKVDSVKDSLQRLETQNELKKEESIKTAESLGSDTEFLKGEVAKKIEEFKGSTQELNNSYDDFDRVVTGISSRIFDNTHQIYSWFLLRNKDVFREFKYLLFAATAIFVMVYFAIYKFQLSIEAVFFPCTLILIIVYLQLSEEKTRKFIENNQTTLEEPLSKVKTTASEMKGRNVKKSFSSNKIDEYADSIELLSKKAISLIKAYFPSIENAFNLKETIHKQMIFANTFLKALMSYSIDIDSKTNEYLNTFSSLSNSEEEWLEEGSTKISKTISINPIILSLIYFDYTESKPELKNTWSIVKKDRALIEELIKLVLSKEKIIEYADTKGIKSYDAIVQMVIDRPYFSLPEFKELWYQFYVQLANRKSHLINTISDLGYNTDETDSKIKRFVPSDSDPVKWEEELVNFASNLIDIDSEVLSLFYYDSIGVYKKRKETWNSILKNNDLFKNFINILVYKEKLKIPEYYQNQPKTLNKIKSILEKQDEFDFFRIRSSIDADFKEIDIEKSNILEALKDFGISLQSKKSEKDFQKFIPFSDDYTNEISDYLEKELKLSSSLILLFYGSKYDPKKRNKVFDEIKKNKREIELATILVNQKLIKIGSDADLGEEANNIALILRSISEFNLLEIQNLYLSYRGLLEISTRAFQFLKEEDMIKDQDLTFESVMKVIPKPMENERLENIISIFRYALKDFKTTLAPESVSIASACIFLVGREDVSSRGCCLKAQLNTVATRILYHNMMMKEAGILKKEKYPLSSVVKQVAIGKDEDGKELKYEKLIDFDIGLSAGVLYQSTKDMMSKKLDDIKEQMTQVEEISKEINKIKDSIRGMLDVELPIDFLTYAIQSQLIQAYVMSKTSGKPIFGDILRRMQRLSANDPSFKDILILGEPEEDQSIGQSMRIGVVPFGMDFDIFSKKFYDLFENAVSEYKKAYPEDNASRDKFSVNIFRILASPATFKRIPEIGSESDPIKIIKSLIIDKFKINDNLSLIASSRDEKDRKVVVRKVLEELFNAKSTTIYSLVENELKTMQIEQDVTYFLSKKDFDKKLYAKFSSSNFTELAKGIHKLSESQKEDKVISALERGIKEIFVDSDVKVTASEIESIAKSIFNTLSKIGKVMSY